MHALIDTDHDDLVKQWESLIADLKRTDPPPSKLEWGPHFDVEDQGAKVVQVTVPLRAVWWREGGMSMKGTEYPWVFVARAEDGGWRIAQVRPHPWCGGHVQAVLSRATPVSVSVSFARIQPGPESPAPSALQQRTDTPERHCTASNRT